MAEVRRLRSEARGWKTDGRSPDVRGMKAEVQGLRSEVRSPVPIHRAPQAFLEIHFRAIAKMRFRLGDIGQ